MKKTAFLFLLIAAASVHAQTTSTPTIPKEWKARYAVYVKTITDRNFKGWQSYLAPEFEWILPDGKVLNRKEAIASAADIFKASKIKGNEKCVKFARRGEMVDLTMVTKLTLSYAGKPDTIFTEKSVDTWRKINGKWMMVKSTDEPETKKPSK